MTAIASGDTADAISSLQDLLWKVDGCGTSADKNDWIVDCAEQVKIRTSINLLIASLGG